MHFYHPAFVRCVCLLAFVSVALPGAAQQPPKDDSLKTLTVEVIDKETGKPIPFIPLAVQLDTGQTRTTTDDNGKAMINLLAEQKYVGVTAKAEGYVPLQVSWRNYDTKDPVPETYTLKMEKGTTIGGIIHDEAGKPISGATVSLLINRKGDRNESRERVTIWDQEVKTDENGKWQYDYAPKEMEEPNVRLKHPDFLSDPMYGSTPKPPLAKFRDMTGVMVMKKGVPVAGRVLDVDGQPIAGADVAQGGDRFGSNFPSTKTDGSGTFQFGHVRPNAQLVLTVKAKGYSPDLKSIPVANDPIDVDFKLEPGRVIRGRVVDIEGKPIPRVMIATDTWRGSRSLMVRLNTDNEGKFVWNDAPADVVLTDFLKQGYSDLRHHPLKPSDDEIVVTLKPMMKVTGTVVDADTGKPVESFNVIQGIDWGNGQQIYWERRNNRPIRSQPGGKFEFTISYPRNGYAVRIEADGYLPAESKTFKDDQQTVSLEFKLKPAQMIAGIVKLPGGEPVPDAEVLVATPSGGAYIRNGQLDQRDGASVKTDAAGKYKVPPQVGKFSLIVVHDKGYADVPGEQIAKSADITLLPWGRVQGLVKVGSKPAAGQMISVNRWGGGGRDEPRVYHQIDGPTDQDGKFSIDRIPPGKASVALQLRLSENMTGYASSQTVEIEAGKTIQVTLGGTGRPIIGKINIPPQIAGKVNWQYSSTGLRTNVKVSTPKQPDNFAEMDEAARRKWWEDWNKSPEAQAARKAQEEAKYFALRVNNDATFRVEDVPAGPYILYVNLMEPPVDTSRGWRNEQLANGQMEFTVPEMPGGRSDEPLDVGALELKVVMKLKVGDQAPDFETKTLDGKPLRFSDFKGKTVLVDFWTSMYSGSPAHVPQMKATFDAHGMNEKFVMLSLSMDDKPQTTKKFVEKMGLPWTHAYLGTWDKTDVPRQWGMQNYPSNYLVGPDGKILAKGIALEQLKAEVGKALAKPQ